MVDQTGAAPGRLAWRFFRLMPGLSSVHLLAQIMRSLFILVPGLVLRQLFEYLEQQPVRPGSNPLPNLPWSLLALLITIGVIRAVSIVGTTYVQSTTWGYDTARMRESLLRKLLHRPEAHTLPLSAGDAADRMNVDVSELGQFVANTYSTIATAILGLASLTIMIVIRWQIAVFAALPIVLVSVVLRLAQDRLQQYRRASREAQGEVTGFLGEIFGSIQAVKVATAEGQVLAHFEGLNESRKETVLRERLFEQLNVLAIFNNISNFAIGFILLLAAGAMSVDGDGSAVFTVGDFSLFVYLMAQVADFLLSGSWWLANYRQQFASLERLAPLLVKDAASVALEDIAPAGRLNLAPQAKTTSLPAGFGITTLQRLNVEGLTFHYPDSAQGIQNISFTMQAGQLTVIAGKIGSGKTTLLRALLGLVPADAGQIYWNERLVGESASFFQPPFTAFVPQIPQLMSKTLAENIVLGLPLGPEQLAEAVAAAVLVPDVAQLDYGLATEVGPRGVRLSGGQVQRTAAARMFIRQPALIVCDDLSSALDVETEQLLWRNLLAGGNRTACLLVSHHRPVWALADQIILLADGQISDLGTYAELLDRSELMRELAA